MAETAIMERTEVVRRGRRLEYFTVTWNALEGLVGVIAGALAGSISLVGFGIASFIEVASGAALLGACRSMQTYISRVRVIKAARGRQQLSPDCHTVPCCTSGDCDSCCCRRTKECIWDLHTCG